MFFLCQGSERSNIILFLTDGNPNDADKAQIYQEIEEGQERLVCNLSLNELPIRTSDTNVRYD